MARDDGGSAFPLPETERTYYQPGMTLRDFFAAQFIEGWYSSVAAGGAFDTADVATKAYQAADAMLIERAKP